MPFPRPIPGLVIRYAYLWNTEEARGQAEGVKDRPCAIVLVTRTIENRERVVVLPVTHTPPDNPALSIEIPQSTKRRLGLDTERSWVVLSEVNIFFWPGPDLRPAINGELDTIVYGTLPEYLTFQIRDRLKAILKSGKASIVTRGE